ncbi:MAG: hypothetical protein K2X86_02940 [Cytophagaceae bacterium]|nr:hypothetical protein [Cytophagaceae bacterium]
MKPITYFTLVFCFMTILFTGCSKDKMLEKRIRKKEGEWKIESANWTIVYQNMSGQFVRTGTTATGSFTFEKNGEGTYSYSIDTLQRTGKFTWDVNSQKLEIIKVGQTIDFLSGTVYQKAVNYIGTETDKGEVIVIEGTETDQEVGSGFNQFALTATFTLKKDN